MNKITLLLFFFLGWASLISAQNFEGTVNMHQQTANGIEYDVTWYIKKDKIAFEITSESARGTTMRFVPQTEKKSMLMIIGENKQEIPLDQITAIYNFENIKTEIAPLQSNGTFDKINKYTISTEDISAEVELTTDIDISFKEYRDFFKNDCGLYILATSGKKGFPINSIVKDKKGNVIIKNTFKSAKKILIDDSKFK